MRTLTTCLALAGAILAADAISLLKRTDGSAPRVVEHTIQRRHITNPLDHDRRRWRKRANTLSVQLDNEETLYFMNASIGTPEQSFQLHLDTGSSDLWVNVADSRLCQARGEPCAVSGTYSANDSSTYQYVNSDFNITYADGSGSLGDYATDVVKIGGITLEKQQFGIGYESSSEQGIMGIGYPANEVSVQYNRADTYANVPQALMENGIINTNAYSLWLNDLDASTGSILFGGVNQAKYTGALETLPIIKEQGSYAEFIIALTGVGQDGKPGSLATDQAIPVLLDSGSSLIYLPDSLCNTIFTALDAQYDDSQGAAFVDCDLANSDSTLDFTFSSPTIRVPLNELVVLVGYDRRQPVCILGIAPAGSTTPVLGDTFLRSAYVVYDLSRNEISLAQTNFNATGNDVLEISNESGVPDATVVPNPVTAVAVQSGGARIGSGYGTITSDGLAARPTAPPGWNLAVMGAAAAAAGAAFAL